MARDGRGAPAVADELGDPVAVGVHQRTDLHGLSSRQMLASLPTGAELRRICARSRHIRDTSGRFSSLRSSYGEIGDHPVGPGDGSRGDRAGPGERRTRVPADRPAALDAGGEQFVRFAYTTGGSARRGPVTLRAGTSSGCTPARRAAGARGGARAAGGGASSRGGARLGRRDDRRRPGSGRGEHARAGGVDQRREHVRPSPEPSSGSTACSGWGIRPMTLPRVVDDAGDVGDRAVRVLPGS